MNSEFRSFFDNYKNRQENWGKLYYGIVSKEIEANGYTNIAEVGLGFGSHAYYVLDKNPEIETFHLIDPFIFYENDWFPNTIRDMSPVTPNNQFNELYDLIQNELSPWSDKTIFYRKKSTDVTDDEIAEESLDLVFLDADHRYESVKADLPHWWAKVRVGGTFIGDDYWMDSVKQAVDEFVAEKSLSLEMLPNEDNTYSLFCIRKVA